MPLLRLPASMRSCCSLNSSAARMLRWKEIAWRTPSSRNARCRAMPGRERLRLALAQLGVGGAQVAVLRDQLADALVAHGDRQDLVVRDDRRVGLDGLLER